ncbi:multicopper oxidase family protein [Stutzerimonas zhaodongensis]|uniref:multicopper oxidase family protein n=1 Tax=Stutzerimonas zhaodongensis TaxID=1176257 RepID=UPI002104A4B9|nr:multicopper oxidase family protein [Stutzerimonas zhaodongensis]MCQ2031744.1 multicopper oxidase family protein [Stutzerimonas zhaodongensis]
MTFTRRKMLVGMAGVVALGVVGGGARYWLGRPADPVTHDYELIAAPADIELVAGAKTPAWCYGGQAPGVELRARQGDWLRVRFINHLPEPTTIHWHGIRLPLNMDGVPYVSQLPVMPGESFDYLFQVHDAGSFWYHPHTTSAGQLGRGLVGPLIVEEREPSGFRHERTLSLKNWHVDKQGALTDFSVPREAARAGTPGVLSTVNGEHAPTLELPAGQVVRLRILNVTNTLTYRLNLSDGQARIYAIDGHPILPRPLGKEYWLGPGMRIDLALKVPAVGEHISLRNGPLRLATLASVATAETEGDWPAPLPANPVAEPDLEKAETLRFNFEWAGTLSADTGPTGAFTFWQINGQAWDINDKTCADRPIATLQRDGHYIFELRNLSQYQHPIHLHGMTFKVISSNRKRIDPWFTDTYLLGKNETARIALVADNPGVWMFHCHVIDHMETGLMAAIEVV